MKRLFTIMILLLMMQPVAGYAASPTETLKQPLDEVIRILKDPQYKTDKAVQREKIWSIIRDIFDFNRISMLTLGKYRKKFSDKEMKEFTDHFSKLLENTYLTKIQAEYKNEKINYLEEKFGGDNNDRALVKTEVTREGVTIPVDYTMWLNKGLWRVYDVKVEGVSLVKNYRNQFRKILLNNSPAHLVEKVKEKVETQGKEE